MVACQPAEVCQGANNAIICTIDRDCPTQAPGSCSPLGGGGADAGFSIRVCPQQ
jgi:membrane-associated PAP2 superfamily phosphatase